MDASLDHRVALDLDQNRLRWLSRHENLSLDGKRALKTLLAANQRLNTVYLIKKSFGQLLWSYGAALPRELVRQER